ncbi:MAG: hypothetical protein LBS25_06930 [Candidatus Symbiothrix sp.]|jgi:predicted restriction endonuclease|nr:hypothetical protein [Candidatus Symbiothrix sp.]
MKTRGLVTLMVCLASLNWSVFAQQTDEQRKARFEKFKAERIAHITQAVGLTAEEATNFWPIENEFQKKKFELNQALRAELRKIRQAKRNNETVSEADYKKVIELSLAIKLKEAELEKEYITKLLKVVSAEKVLLYQNAEQEFAKKALDNRQRERGGRRQ